MAEKEAVRQEFEKWYSKSGFNHRYCAEESWKQAYLSGERAMREKAAEAISEEEEFWISGRPALDKGSVVSVIRALPLSAPQQKEVL